MALLLIVTLDTSILRYFDTLIRSMPRLDLVVYDSSPPLLGASSCVAVRQSTLFDLVEHGCETQPSVRAFGRRAYGFGRKSGLGLFGYFLWKYRTKVGEFRKSSAGSQVISS